MTRPKPTAFWVSAWVLLAGALVFGSRQDRELSGIRGLPVEGHTIVAGIKFVGTRQLESRSEWEKLERRLQAHHAQLRLGWPLENQTLCRFKEVVRDVMTEKGFPDVEVTHDTKPTYGDRRQVTLEVTIVEGARSRGPAPKGTLVSPAERCMR